MKHLTLLKKILAVVALAVAALAVFTVHHFRRIDADMVVGTLAFNRYFRGEISKEQSDGFIRIESINERERKEFRNDYLEGRISEKALREYLVFLESEANAMKGYLLGTMGRDELREVENRCPFKDEKRRAEFLLILDPCQKS